MTTRGDVRQAVAEALIGATIAGGRVFTPLDWDTWDGDYPCAIVRAPEEEKQSLGRGPPQFTVTATIEVTFRLQVLADSADIAALKAEMLLEAVEDQVLRAVINYPPLMAALQQHPFIRIKTGFSSKGEEHLAEMVAQIGCEFYQGPEDFFPTPMVELQDVRLNDPGVFTTSPPEVEADIPIPQS
jgi:hypothetical protein